MFNVFSSATQALTFCQMLIRMADFTQNIIKTAHSGLIRVSMAGVDRIEIINIMYKKITPVSFSE